MTIRQVIFALLMAVMALSGLVLFIQYERQGLTPSIACGYIALFSAMLLTVISSDRIKRWMK